MEWGLAQFSIWWESFTLDGCHHENWWMSPWWYKSPVFNHRDYVGRGQDMIWMGRRVHASLIYVDLLSSTRSIIWRGAAQFTVFVRVYIAASGVAPLIMVDNEWWFLIHLPSAICSYHSVLGYLVTTVVFKYDRKVGGTVVEANTRS